ncbi:MAG TPA: acyl-CoA dehydrogenase [Chloroflexi bacterium]|jgi:acyl-CoA dehydrogenase|nr:acyl-CoA dehydrogenase [Chloroflexota bacterium]
MPVDFGLTAQQFELRATAHEFAAERIRPAAPYFDDAEEFPWEIVQEAHQLDLSPAVIVPAEYGGGGLDLLSYTLVQEELHWGCAGIAMAITATGLAALAILGMGTEAQKERWLGELTSKPKAKLGATAFTEPGGGSDLLNVRTRAERAEGGYVLNGSKQFITNGGIADIHVVFANTDRDGRRTGIAAFVVEKGNPGLTMVRKESKLGVRASHTAQLAFDDCFVPVENRLGGEPGGVQAGPGALGGLIILERSRPLVAAGAIGIARAAYETALSYANERISFGQPIVRHQGIGFKLAEMAMQIDAARLLVWRAAWMADQGMFFQRGEASMAKAMAADMAMHVTVDAIQVLGGYGYMRDCPLEKWMRDAKIYQIWEGTSEIQRVLIANAVSISDVPRTVTRPEPVAVGRK